MFCLKKRKGKRECFQDVVLLFIFIDEVCRGKEEVVVIRESEYGTGMSKGLTDDRAWFRGRQEDSRDDRCARGGSCARSSIPVQQHQQEQQEQEKPQDGQTEGQGEALGSMIG